MLSVHLAGRRTVGPKPVLSVYFRAFRGCLNSPPAVSRMTGRQNNLREKQRLRLAVSQISRMGDGTRRPGRDVRGGLSFCSPVSSG